MKRAFALSISTVLASSSPVAHGSTDEETLVVPLMIDRIQRAETMTNESPSEGIGELRAALRDFAELAPQVAGDAKAQEARALAQLALARAALAIDDDALADETMDVAIRTARGDAIPSQLFGPRLEQLHRERAAVLHAQGYAALEIHCHTPCDVYLNERRAGTHENRLVLGDYRLWIQARDPDRGTPERRTLALERSGQTVVLDYPRVRESPKAVTPSKPPTLTPRLDSPPLPRLMPRWLEILAISGGTAMVAGGAVMVAFDGVETRRIVDDMKEVYNLKHGGATLIAAGATALIAGIVTLALDRKRSKSREIRDRQARSKD